MLLDEHPKANLVGSMEGMANTWSDYSRVDCKTSTCVELERV